MFNFFAEAFDLPILDWIQANLQSGFMDFIMPIITMFGDAGIFWIAFAVVLLFIPKYRKTGLGMGLALIMGLIICNVILKNLVGRMRPYDYQLEYYGKTIMDLIGHPELLCGPQSDKYFPSGHTIASFEACVVLLMNDKRMGIPALILACLIAFSRLYLYVHYPTDVIASVILGTCFALLANWLVNKYADRVPLLRKGKYEA